MDKRIGKLDTEFCTRCGSDGDVCNGCIKKEYYLKGYAQAKRDEDTRTDIQRFRVSGHP